MSDVLKELKEFKEQAKEFSESFLGSIKENYFLYEENEDSKKEEPKSEKAIKKSSNVKKPGAKKIGAAGKQLATWRSENPNASKEDVQRYKQSLAAYLGVDASLIKEPPEEKKPLSPEERKAEDEKATASRKEFAQKQASDLEARKQNKNKPQPASHEKFKKIPSGMGAGEYKQHSEKEKSAEEKVQSMIASYKERHPNASPEDVSKVLSNIRDHIANQQKKQDEEKADNEKIGFNPPSTADKAREKIKKSFAPKSLQRRKLGSQITSNVSSSKVIPFAKELVGKYVSAKNRMSSFPGSSAHSREDELAIQMVEDLIGLPPLDPSSEESKGQFTQALSDFYSNPTKFLPAPFLQSSLRSYPEELSDKISGKIGSQDVAGPNFDEFMGSIKDLGPNAQRKAIRNLDIGNPADIKGNRIVNYLSKMPLEDMAQLLSYFKDHEDEIQVSERSYRTPEFIAGKGGFEGKTTGDIDDVGDEPLDADMPTDIGSLQRHVEEPELNRLDSKFFDVLNAKDQLGKYFSSFEDLLHTSEGGGNKLAMASSFLQKIMTDPGTSGLVLKALARQYAMSSMENELKRELTEKNFDKQPPEKRRELIKFALAKFNERRLNHEAKAKLPEVKAALGQLKHTSRDGRMTLKDPRGVVWPNDNMKKIGVTLYDKLAPTKLIHGLTGASGEGTPLDNFMLSKADEVHKRILNVIKSIGSSQLAQQQKQNIEGELRQPSSAGAVHGAIKKKMDLATSRAQRKSDVEKERERLGLAKHMNVPGGRPGASKLEPIGLDPKISPHVPELWDPASGRPAHSPQLRNAVSAFRKANPGAGRAEIANFISVFNAMQAKNESFKDDLIFNLVLEGKDITMSNIKKYLVDAVRNKVISKDKLYEVLFDINGEIQSTAREDDWETANKKKRKRVVGG